MDQRSNADQVDGTTESHQRKLLVLNQSTSGIKVTLSSVAVPPAIKIMFPILVNTGCLRHV
jgi:hypothetical protein